MTRRVTRLTTHFRPEWVLLVGLVFIAVFGVGVTREFLRRRVIKTEISALSGTVNSLESRRNELQRLLQEFQQVSVQEREARTKLNLLRPGEKSLVVQTAPSAVATTNTPSATDNDQRSNPVRWWHYFFGNT